MTITICIPTQRDCESILKYTKIPEFAGCGELREPQQSSGYDAHYGALRASAAPYNEYFHSLRVWA